MSRSFGKVSTDYLAGTPAPATAVPLSMAVWANFNSTSLVDAFLFSLGVSGGGSRTNEFLLGLDYDGTAALAAMTYGPSNGTEALSGTTVTASTWHHCGAAYSSVSARVVVLDGVVSSINNTSETPVGINAVRISGDATSSGFYFGGLEAHLATWNRALTAIEWTYLAGGGNPQSVQGLIYYCRLTQGNSPETADVGTTSLTVTGTTVSSNNPTLATWFTGAAIANQVYTQGTAITPIAVGSEFQACGSAFTVTLQQLGSAGTATTASAAGTTTTQVPLTSASGFSAGSLLVIGSNAPALILAISGTTALIAGAQSWSNGATVTPYGVASPTIAGCSVTSGSWGGTPTGTQAAIPNYFFLATNNTNSALVAISNLFSIAINSGGPTAPTFAQNPSIAQTLPTGVVINVLPSAACTGYAAAYLAGSTAPTAAQVIAGTGAAVSSSAALTGTSTGQISLTGWVFPVYDVYIVLSNTNGNSAVFPLTGQLRAPLAGMTFRPFASVASGTLYTGNVSVGDIEETSLALSPSGNQPTYRTDGNEGYPGAGATSRQVRTSEVYNYAGQAWYVPTPAIVGPMSLNGLTVYYNDTAPSFNGGSPSLQLVQGQAVTNGSNLAQFFTSIYGDPLLVTGTGMPAGITIVGNVPTGTTQELGTFPVTMTATDLALLTGTGTLTITVASSGPPPTPSPPSLDVPNVVGETQLQAQATAAEAGYEIGNSTSSFTDV